MVIVVIKKKLKRIDFFVTDLSAGWRCKTAASIADGAARSACSTAAADGRAIRRKETAHSETRSQVRQSAGLRWTQTGEQVSTQFITILE